jgi:hypothetical protein
MRKIGFGVICVLKFVKITIFFFDCARMDVGWMCVFENFFFSVLFDPSQPFTHEGFGFFFSKYVEFIKAFIKHMIHTQNVK